MIRPPYPRVSIYYPLPNFAEGEKEINEFRIKREHRVKTRTFFPRAVSSFSNSTKDNESAFLITGVTSPFGVATATLRST